MNPDCACVAVVFGGFRAPEVYIKIVSSGETSRLSVVVMSSKLQKKGHSTAEGAHCVSRSTPFSDPNLVTCFLNHGVANSAQHVFMHALRPVSVSLRDEIDDIVDRAKRISHDIHSDVATNAQNGGLPPKVPNWQLNMRPSGKNPSSLPDWMYDFHKNAASMTVANMKTFLETPSPDEAADMAQYTSVRIHIKRMNLLQTMYMDAPACTIIFGLFSEVAKIPAEFKNMKAVLNTYFPRQMDELYSCIFTAVHVHAGNETLMFAAWTLLAKIHDTAAPTLYRMPEHCQLACDMLHLFGGKTVVVFNVVGLFLVEKETSNFFDAVVGIVRDTFSQRLSEVMKYYLQQYQDAPANIGSDDNDVHDVLLGTCTVICQLWQRLDVNYYECDGFENTVEVLASCMLSVHSDRLSIMIMQALYCILQNMQQMTPETRKFVRDLLDTYSLVDKTLSYWQAQFGIEHDKIGLRLFGHVVSLGFKFSNDPINVRMIAIERAAQLARDAVHANDFDECHAVAADVFFALAFEKDLNWQRESRKTLVDMEIISLATMVIANVSPYSPPLPSPIQNVNVIHRTSAWVSILQALVIGNVQNETKVIQFGAIDALSTLISCPNATTKTTDLDNQVVIFLCALVQAQYELILQRDTRRLVAYNPQPTTCIFSNIIQSVARAIQRPAGITIHGTQCSVDLLYFLYRKNRLSSDDAEEIFHAIAYILKHQIKNWGQIFSSPILRRILDIMLLAMEEKHAGNALFHEIDFVFPGHVDSANKAAMQQVKYYLSRY